MQNQSQLITAALIKQTLREGGLYLAEYNFSPHLILNKMNTDSRTVEKDDAFICIKGYRSDGHDYIYAAITAGATLLITTRKIEAEIPVIEVTDSRKAAALLARIFFEDPSSKLSLIGVTGTNGKTTIVELTARLMQGSGIRTGTIGTLGYSIGSTVYTLDRTTPDIIELNSILRKMVTEKVQVVIMEVSSHSIYLDRIYGLSFSMAVFTNLSTEHLDFHETLDAYAEIKFRFLENTGKQKGKIILNIDDHYGRIFREKLGNNTCTISFLDQKAHFLLSQISTKATGSFFDIFFDSRKLHIKTQLIGKHNIFNLGTALAILHESGINISSENLLAYTTRLTPIPGRLHKVSEITGRQIFIDYAHTPDALNNVLLALKDLKPDRLICVLGAGGNRDKIKRPLMYKTACEHADLIFLTNDNPRNEEPAQIIRDMLANYRNPNKTWIVRNRKHAINAAVRLARNTDIVLIAGKGHERYQEINGIKYPFDDYEESRLAAEKSCPDGLAITFDPLNLELLGLTGAVNMKIQSFHNISTDSRSISDGELFFALRGENFDGHDYIEDILKKEHCAAVINKDYQGKSSRLLRVTDTRQAYGRMAAHYKEILHPFTIAITGSVGKTTVKEYISNIISCQARVLKTHDNENNLIGLPKTLLKLGAEHDYAVLELGSNQKGEIAALTGICNPDVGIITAVGIAHLEFFDDLQGVFREKTALFKHNLKLRFFPGDNELFTGFSGISCGWKNHNRYRISEVKSTSDRCTFSVNGSRYSIPTAYEKFAENALFAIACCLELGFDKATIAAGLEKPLPVSYRMEIRKEGSRIILADCYNANPDSMKSALYFWKNYEPQRPHVAVLGDMLELGKLTEKYHQEISLLLENVKGKLVFSIGCAAKLYKADRHFSTCEDFISSGIWREFPPDAIILLKASHSIGLEKILEGI
ncbi:MAG: UDP-N-acetylmuramoyl-L-alanyl-D-glutamate--2,6-diaminopimelate ligase [Candidatus Cloacimonetes bacterium]|nr:UDP-N-acetylmuramoyl-L-alanyl-D-glutamate--2,6-diaminopimelate ligase [Candidatus Cloacimonadota bacterium]